MKKLYFLLLIPIALAALTVVALRGPESVYPDERGYYKMAGRLMRGEGYVEANGDPAVFRPPAYPGLLAVARLIYNRPTAARIFNIATLLGAALIMAVSADRIQPNAGRNALIMIWMYPVFFYTAALIYPQIPGALCWLAVLYLTFFGQTHRHTMFAGLLHGLLCLMIPAFLMMTPVPLTAAWQRAGQGAKKRAGLFLLIAAITVLPWTIRNAIVFHRFIPVSANAGINLLLGNNPRATAGSGTTVDIDTYIQAAPEADAARRDAFFFKQAIIWISENPARSARLYVAKFIHYFNFRNQLYIASEASPLKNIVMAVGYYGMWLLFLSGALRWNRQPLTHFEKLLLAAYLLHALASAVFITRIRFRIPMDFMLLILAAGAVQRHLNALTHARKTRDPHNNT